jgi:hypothetical protein
MLYISGLILFLLTLFTTYLTQKSQLHPKMKVVIPASVAVILFSGNAIIDKIGEKWSHPVFTIKTSVKDNTVSIYLTLMSGNLSTLVVDYPVRGRITRIADLNSATDVRTVSMTAIGTRKPRSLEDAEIDTENIRQNTTLQYDISYEPVKVPSLPHGLPPFFKDVMFSAIDVYKVSYTWRYKGNELHKTEWRLVRSDQITNPPPFEVRGGEVYDWAPTDEEAKKIMKNRNRKGV